MKKKKLLIVLIVLLVGGAVMFGLLFSKGFKRQMSLNRIKKMKPQYTGLIYASLSNGGGMNGERYLTSIGYDENKKIIYTSEASPEHYVPSLVKVYEVEDPDAMKELDAFVAEYNMSVWNKIPLSEMQVLDAPSTSLNLCFKASEDQKYADFMSISYDLDLSSECFEVLHDFTRKMSSYPMKLIDKYIEEDGEKIYVSRDIENTDEQIKLLLTGYFANKAESVAFVDGYEGALRIRGIYNDEIKDYELIEIVHEPYKDYDCSWYARYGNDDGELIITAVYENMYVEDNQGNIIELERY